MSTSLTQRMLVHTYLALMLLLAFAFGSYYLNLGVYNIVLNIGIAVLKTLLIMAIFMRLRFSSMMVRIAAAAGFFWLAILVLLTLSDVMTR